MYQAVESNSYSQNLCTYEMGDSLLQKCLYYNSHVITAHCHCNRQIYKELVKSEVNNNCSIQVKFNCFARVKYVFSVATGNYKILLLFKVNLFSGRQRSKVFTDINSFLSCLSKLIRAQMEHYPANIYLFTVNNKYIRTTS